MSPDSLPEYRINLELDEPLRWREVIAKETATARQLFAEAEGEFSVVPQGMRQLFTGLYRLFGGLYRKEIRAWAEATGHTIGTVTILNCAYELSHLPPKLFGCTAGVTWVDGLGLLHARALAAVAAVPANSPLSGRARFRAAMSQVRNGACTKRSRSRGGNRRDCSSCGVRRLHAGW
jgi:hypothetical protein